MTLTPTLKLELVFARRLQLQKYNNIMFMLIYSSFNIISAMMVDLTDGKIQHLSKQASNDAAGV